MYSNYNYPMNMPNSYPPKQANMNGSYQPQANGQNDDRLIGGFAFPFLLGGVTGAALAPAFWNGGYNRPYYNNYYYYPPYRPYPYYYGPYYR